MALLVARPATDTNVFEQGNLIVQCITVEKSNASSSPPKSLLIVTPTVEGRYPVLLFLHGFCIRNTSYTQLLQHISSHGFVVVAPQGNLTVKCITAEKSNASSSPPKSLLIVTPTVEGTYPVLLFLHGFCIRNTSYTQLLQHISSHGFIVVAPQLYYCMFVTGTEEVHSAAAVTNWLSTGLQPILPVNVQADLLKLALAGHSRGGKAAFALALGHAQTSLNFSVLLGLDPVAGLSIECQINPKILTYVPRSFDLAIPVAVIGTGLGDDKKCGMFPACAPNGVNHDEFFTESKPPCCYFYAKDYGHTDMLDDAMATLSSCLCVSGKGAKDPFRKCLGGIFVAFLRANLEGEKEDLEAIIDDPAIAPVTLDPVIYIEA